MVVNLEDTGKSLISLISQQFCFLHFEKKIGKYSKANNSYYFLQESYSSFFHFTIHNVSYFLSP